MAPPTPPPVQASEESQRYKVGRFILERARVADVVEGSDRELTPADTDDEGI